MSVYITNIKQAAQILAAHDTKLVNFTHNFSYDTYLARAYYDDFVGGLTGFEVQTMGAHQTDYMIVYSSGHSMADKYYRKSALVRMRKADLLELCEMLELPFWDCDTKNDLIEYLLNVDYEDYFKGYYAAVSFHDMACDLDIAGYSQGDRIKIVLIGDDAKRLTSEHMTQLFFDCPASGSVEVFENGTLVMNLYIDEIIDDPYNWDKVQAINNISNATLKRPYHALLNAWALENLPDTLDYL